MDFEASKKFQGSRPGYVFKTGDEGTGYYLDKTQIQPHVTFNKFPNDGSYFDTVSEILQKESQQREASKEASLDGSHTGEGTKKLKTGD